MLPISAAELAAPSHYEERTFTEFATFLDFLQASPVPWSEQVQQALRLIALNGIVDPISREWVPPSAIRIDGSNYRETLEHQGCISRHRAVLLALQGLIASSDLPDQQDLTLYCPELITPFATLLRRLFPGFLGSEFLADPADPRRQQIPHQDLCALSFTDACMDVVLCNDLFEHLYDLPAALAEIARILRPGGHLLATFPFAYNCQDTTFKVRHRPGAIPGDASQEELLEDPEYHGNPVDPESGSLVYQIPGWDLLDQVRQAGLRDPRIHWIAAPSYGVVGQEIPAVLVLVARR